MPVLLLIWYGPPGMTGVDLPLDDLRETGRVVDVEEAPGATLTAVARDDNVEFHIDKLWQGSSKKNHWIMAAHPPALLHGASSDVPVIGVGVGPWCPRTAGPS